MDRDGIAGKGPLACQREPTGHSWDYDHLEQLCQSIDDSWLSSQCSPGAR